MTCLLFHGPGALAAAEDRGREIGELMVPPIGDPEGGLKVDEVREAVGLLSSSPLGGRVGVVIVGPMDLGATLKSADALLKSIEEYRVGVVQPILWAHDLGGVPRTIRSRCLEVWSPGAARVGDGDLRAGAWALVDAARVGDWVKFFGALRGLGEVKDARGLADALVECIQAQSAYPGVLGLWERLRGALVGGRQVTVLDLVAGLVSR